MDLSDWAIWYASVVATAALLLELARYARERLSRLHMSVQSQMIPLLAVGHQDPKDTHRISFVIIDLRHVSGPPTTLTNVGFRVFRSAWHHRINRCAPRWLRGKVPFLSPVANYWMTQMDSLPKRLEVGDFWTGHIEQSEVAEIQNKGAMYAVVAHTLTRRELRKRVWLET